MKQHKKRIFGILLSFALMLTMMPALSLTALAATGGNIPDTNLTWELSDTGTLTISGTGEMIDYGIKDPPWKSYKDNIKSIVINDGVTKIGNSAFSVSMNFCTENLTQVTIPSSVTSVGTYVFNQCSGIDNVSLGCSVIGEGMFQGCSGLTQITIPSNVTSIAKNAFNGCSGLTQITIPSNVTSIGTAAFYNCTNLEKVTFTPAEEGKTLEIGGASFSDNAKVAYGTGNTRLYDGDTEIKANASLSSYNNKTLTWKQGTPATEYPLWVGGIQVTSDNAGNIDGNNKASYDAENNILKLNGYDNEGAVGDKYAGIRAEGDLIIETTGTNAISNNATIGDQRAINISGDLTFKGSGTLNATGGITIYAHNVTIESGTVVATGSDPGHATIGADSDITIKGGNVEATSTAHVGISAVNKVMISAGSVKAAGAYGGIGALNGVTINNGTVEATASADNSYGMSGGSSNSVEIINGQVIASGSGCGIKGTVKNHIAGTGWDNTEGTGDEHAIEVNTDPGQTLDYKKVQFPAKVDPEPTPTPTPKKPQTVGKTTVRNTVANSAKKTNDVIYDAVAGATGYDIAYKHKNSSKWVIKKVGKTTRATIGGLTVGGMYQIKVRAKKAETAKYKAATGAWSPVINRYFHTTQKIRLASKAKRSFTMSWKTNPQATGYQVMFSTKKNGSGAAKNINTVGKNATSFTKVGLKSGTTYYVQVREIVKIGNVNYVGNISCPVAVKVK